MNVVLLGAGASKAYGASPTGRRMPIATDFFPIYRELEIYNNPWVLRGQLEYFIRKERGLDPETILSGDFDIEDLHSDIEERMYETLNDASKLDRIIHLAAFTELSSVFACVINTIQSGPVSLAHQRLAQRLKREDRVITFNWDTLMERALEVESDWVCDSGYGFSPRGIFRNEWVRPNNSGSVGNHPVVHKLHGSSNWMTSYPMAGDDDIKFTHEASPDSVWIFESTDQPYDCYAGRFMPGYERLSFGYYPPNLKDVPGISAPEGYVFFQARPKHPGMPEGTAGSDGLPSVPLIVPPVRQKRYDLYGDLFTAIWDSAEDALAEASRIVVIGYSFPRTDLKSHDLFRQAFVRRSTIPEVVILDPNPERVAETFKFSFGIPDSHLTVLKEYFEEDYDLDKLGI